MIVDFDKKGFKYYRAFIMFFVLHTVYSLQNEWSDIYNENRGPRT